MESRIGQSDPFVAWARGDVDFIWIFEGWQGFQAQLRGVDLSIVRLSEWTHCVPDYYTPVLITSEQTIADNPGLVQRFIRGTAKGYEYAIDHPEEAADILIASAEGIEAELVRLSQPWLSQRYAEDAERWGVQTDAKWTAFADWLFEHGLIAKQIEASKAFDNSFIERL